MWNGGKPLKNILITAIILCTSAMIRPGIQPSVRSTMHPRVSFQILISLTETGKLVFVKWTFDNSISKGFEPVKHDAY